MPQGACRHEELGHVSSDLAARAGRIAPDSCAFACRVTRRTEADLGVNRYQFGYCYTKPGWHDDVDDAIGFGGAEAGSLRNPPCRIAVYFGKARACRGA
jgi:hypothetical protein